MCDEFHFLAWLFPWQALEALALLMGWALLPYLMDLTHYLWVLQVPYTWQTGLITVFAFCHLLGWYPHLLVVVHLEEAMALALLLHLIALLASLSPLMAAQHSL